MKSQNLLTTEYYVKKWPYILIYQHQGITVPMWQKLRSKLDNTMECMVIKNTVINRIFNNNKITGGSMCLIGVSSMDDFKHLSDITNYYNYKLLLVGGYWNKQCWSHNDVKRICNLGSMNNIISNLIITITQNQQRILTVVDKNNLFISNLESNNLKVYDTLIVYSQQNDTYCIYTK